ncbi:MAG: hypothetical protein LBU51_05890 [Bacteroidales bacterium]|jgi:cell shape-determining protein MreD|nr:hypothetical protein [Bacteroidales bacterium]
MNKIVVNIGRFLIFITLQVLICNYISLFHFLNPYVYIFCLLFLPIEVPKVCQYIIAFFTGLIIDFFALSYGVHTFACLILMFVKPYLINRLNGQKSVKEKDFQIFENKPFKWMLIYVVTLTFLHHLLVVFLEVFSFHSFFISLSVVVGNTILTTTLILAIHYIISPTTKKTSSSSTKH